VTAILLVLGVDQLSTIFLEARERACLIRAHQPAIAGHIGGENSGEFAFDLIRNHSLVPDRADAAETISHHLPSSWIIRRHYVRWGSSTALIALNRDFRNAREQTFAVLVGISPMCQSTKSPSDNPLRRAA
jgi:hypothetical protein